MHVYDSENSRVPSAIILRLKSSMSTIRHKVWMHVPCYPSPNSFVEDNNQLILRSGRSRIVKLGKVNNYVPTNV